MPAEGLVPVADQERNRVVDLLGEQVGAGRLNLQEFDDRVTAAYAATTLADLNALVSDLPVRQAPIEQAPVVRSSQPWVSRPRGPRVSPGAAQPWAAWLLTSLITTIIWAATALGGGGDSYFWPIWVIGPWGAVLLVQAVAARLRSPSP